MNVLLVSPEFPDSFWSFKHALKFVRRKASFAPLGLLTVAAMLPPAWEKRLVDMNVRSLEDADIAWADMAFVGGMIAQAPSARRVIARLKRAGVTVVGGGPLFAAGTDVPPEDLFPEVDHLVLNEAEVTLPRFLADLEAGHAARVYASSEFADLATSPVPAWELADLDRYVSASLQTSRGCPYDCEFCNITVMHGRRPRVKSAAQVIAELDRLVGLGWRGSVFIADDNFIGNRRAVEEELLPALIAWGARERGIAFTCQVSMNLADSAGLIGRLAEAGVSSAFIGIESPDEEALAGCDKKQNLGRNLVEDVKRIQRAGIQVYGGFILGFDSDTPASFQRQVDFIQRSGIATAMVGLLQALPGTRLHARMRREGRLVGTTSGDNVDGTTNVVPAMGLETLREGYRRVLGEIYSPRQYYRRVRTYLREVRVPVARPRTDFRRVWAFVRSAGELGVLRRERFHYWGLIAWTLTHRPKLLSQAVTLAIYGYHFRRVVELNILR